MLEVLSLGAGVQSTTVFLMSIEGELPALNCAIFADTGWEPAEVYRNLEWLIGKFGDVIPIHVVRSGNIRDDHTEMNWRGGLRTTIPFFVDTGGLKEGRTFRKCTKEYKLEPIHKFMRSELLGLTKGQHAPKTPVMRHWLGISSDEWTRAKPSREKWKTNWHPLIELRITRGGCLEWLRKRGYPEPPQSACIGCSFRSNSGWRRMQKMSPEEFADACEFDKTMRHNGAMGGEAYLHRSLKSLEEVDLRNDVDKGQGLLWQDECDGQCGV